MRRYLILAALAAVAAAASSDGRIVSPALAQQGCTGPNCPPSGGSGGHDCEREKKEQTIS